MAGKARPKPATEKQRIAGRAVEIRRQEGREELWIDGIRHKFFASADGYNLYVAAHTPPQKTLLDAVKTYLRKHPLGGKTH